MVRSLVLNHLIFSRSNVFVPLTISWSNACALGRIHVSSKEWVIGERTVNFRVKKSWELFGYENSL